MKFKNKIYQNLILPISDVITGNNIAENLKFLSKSQFWTKEQISEYQNHKLQELIAHAYENVPFYRELFQDLRLYPEDIQTTNDLSKIPIITKEDLKKAGNKFKAKNISRKELLYRSSSGSTGEPFQFYKTKQSESFSQASAIRAWGWMGYSLGERYVKVSMNERSSFKKKLQDKVNRSLYLSAQQLTSKVFQDIAAKINKFDPKFIRCYPVPLLFLAEQIEKTSGVYKGKSLIAINTTGSTLNSEAREKIEKVFGVRIFDSYSCEGGAVFSQCEESKMYHPAHEYAISEFIEDDFSKSNINRPLRHITTDLINYASPFIRYDTQDYVIYNDKEVCNCNRNFSSIKSILGRDSDIIKTPSGKYLIVENFVAYFEWIVEVDQLQVVQDEIDKIVINLVVNDNFNNEVLSKITKDWSQYIGSDVNLSVNIVDNIKLTPTGKRRTIIRNPKIKLN